MAFLRLVTCWAAVLLLCVLSVAAMPMALSASHQATEFPDQNVQAAAAVAVSGIANNRQLHRKELEWTKENAQALADKLGISRDEAEKLLSAELLRRVSDFGRRSISKNKKVSDFVDSQRKELEVVDGQVLFTELDTDSHEFKDSTINWNSIRLYNTLIGLESATEVGLSLKTIAYRDALAFEDASFRQLSKAEQTELISDAAVYRDYLRAAYHANLTSGDLDLDFLSNAQREVDLIDASISRAVRTSQYFHPYQVLLGLSDESPEIRDAQLNAVLEAFGGIEGITASGIARSIDTIRLGGGANGRPSHLTSHPNAHTIDRHGPQVTDQQLETRALTGVAPDGSTLRGGLIPPLSSAFHSDQAMLHADNVMRGQPLRNEIASNPNETVLTFTFYVGENIGRGYRRIGSSNPNNVGRNGPPERVDGLTHAQVTVELNQKTGIWETITMFPALPR